MIWKERKWLLISLGVLLVLNMAFFITYRVRYEKRIEALNADLERSRIELLQAEARRDAAADFLASRDVTVRDLQMVYNEHWATQPQRLAPMIIELQQLARRSGLQPATRSYNWDQVGDRESAIIGARAMTVSFAVTGTYEEVRRLINLIELSSQFVIIDGISFNDSSTDDDALGLSLQIRTLFKSDDALELGET